jgi:XapX domain-containing protein
MKILIAFIVAFGIGAGSRWTGVPSLAPQAIVGALLIVANVMTLGNSQVPLVQLREGAVFTAYRGERTDSSICAESRRFAHLAGVPQGAERSHPFPLIPISYAFPLGCHGRSRGMVRG